MKLLRVLVIFNFLLAAAALSFGALLFSKRELLKGRTQMLEKHFHQVAAFIEDKPGVMATVPSDPQKDLRECQAEILEPDDVVRSDYWSTYQYDLEVQDPEAMARLDNNRLTTYYLRDPVTREIQRDERGVRLTKGEGTMRNHLDSFAEKVEAQYNRLNDTREQLAKSRVELVDTIKELNSRKTVLRERLVHIEKQNTEITGLNTEIAMQKQKNDELAQENSQLNYTIQDRDNEIARHKETIEDQELEIQRLKDLLNGKIPEPAYDTTIAQGQKGVIYDADNDWDFVSVQFNSQFLGELDIHERAEKDPIGLEMFVERPTGPDKFVTKIKLRRVEENGIGIFDIAPGWNAEQIKPGDQVCFYR